MVLNTLPKMIAASHVWKVYSIASAGNKVFNAQMVMNGPAITNAMISRTRRSLVSVDMMLLV